VGVPLVVLNYLGAHMAAVMRALGYDRVDVLRPLNVTALTRQLPTSSVTVFPDSGHGVAFQNHRAFVDAARDFLRR
jgi:pimeloyl-ACP methyl ester carboxylesterase